MATKKEGIEMQTIVGDAQAVTKNANNGSTPLDNTMNHQEQCCFCFDMRKGIMVIGIWLLLQAMLTIYLWIKYLIKDYEGDSYYYVVAVVSIDVGFDLVGSLLGIYGSVKRSHRVIYFFYVWGILRCIGAAIDAFVSFFYLLILLMWIYWTIVIKNYHRILIMQRLRRITGQNNSKYVRYDQAIATIKEGNV